MLDGVDLDIAPGTRVALVGASGAGKTALAWLIAGVHRRPGTVRIGGAALDEQGPAVVRQAFALITQEVHVFAGPLAGDLRLARTDVTDEELRAALGWAQPLPDGLGTVARTGGHSLTVVQAQQLALARLTQAASADTVVVLDVGRVVER